MSFVAKISGKNGSLLAIALFGVLGLGAKGCDRAVVGDDGQGPCENCTSGEGGESSGSGGGDSAGTGGTGQAGKSGHAGSGSAGRGGSGSAGKSGGAGTTGSAGTGSAGTGSGGTTCGGLNDQGCPDGQFCDYPPDAICGAADGTGVCRDIPEVCTEEYAPVCGCDDETYGNACFAAGAGVAVAKNGPCEPDGGVVCGSRAGEQCAEDEFCDYPPESICGRADGPGVCKQKPQACDAIYDPVCGCDGQTYGNACEAELAGVSVETDGECAGDPGGDSCGGLKPSACPDGSFCSYPPEAMCGAADQTGTCVVMPDGCTEQYDPVCGCDGKTYSNACNAASDGMSVQYAGECELTSEETCGGFTAKPCPGDLFCNYPIETMCGSGDQSGTCATKPEVCPAVHAPVCGCDGVTYTNSCAAQGAGVSIMAEGECPKT